MIFDILYQDEYLIAIQKPGGILVHRTKISEDTVFVLQLLRNQLGYRIYPVHRLDRATSGVLLFAKNKEVAAKLGIQFRNREISKEYLAVVRGHLEKQGVIDYPLAKSSKHEKQEAITAYLILSQSEIEVAINRYPTSRYSFVKIFPQTGRHHQIRRHFAHIRHPILGDRPHGDNKHNKYFRDVFNIHRMLLHASTLSFTHPLTREAIVITSPIKEDFQLALKTLRL